MRRKDLLMTSINSTQPTLIQESARGYTHIRLEDELFKSRKIFLTDEINTETAISVIKQLMILDKTDDPSPIQMFISSPGGSIDAGMAIVDVMGSMEKEVDTYCVGLSASMASVIFSCGRKRYMYPSSKLMIHDPLIHETGGNALQLKAVSDSLLEYRETIGKLLAKNTGKPLEEIYDLTSKDTYFTAQEAIDFGLADKIITKGEFKNE